MQQITIVGTVGKDPEKKTTQNGNSCAVFDVAVTGQKDATGNKKTTWYQCKVFGARADVVMTYIKKSSKVTVCGGYDFSFSQKGDVQYFNHNVMVSDFHFSNGVVQQPKTTTIPVSEEDLAF